MLEGRAFLDVDRDITTRCLITPTAHECDQIALTATLRCGLGDSVLELEQTTIVTFEVLEVVHILWQIRGGTEGRGVGVPLVAAGHTACAAWIHILVAWWAFANQVVRERSSGTIREQRSVNIEDPFHIG